MSHDNVRFRLRESQRQWLRELLASVVRPVPANWVALRLDDVAIGSIAVERARRLADVLTGTTLTENALTWHAGARNAAERSMLIEAAARALRDQGQIRGWRDERYACLDAHGHELFRLERAAFRYLGLRSRAAHINGFRRDGRLWIGRRAASKAVDPGRLDNLAAGGLPAGERPESCAIRELWEEAGIHASIARAISASGTVTAHRVEADGLHHEDLHVFNLLVPDDVVPVNQDGEVSGFLCLSASEAVDRMAAGEFTEDAAAVSAVLLLAGRR